MLQHLKCESMALLRNTFECPRNVHRAGQHSLLILFRLSLDCSPKILLILTSSSLDNYYCYCYYYCYYYYYYYYLIPGINSLLAGRPRFSFFLVVVLVFLF